MLHRYLLLAAFTLVPALAHAQPDLAMTAFSAEPDAVAVGEDTFLEYTLCNLGSVAVPEPVVGFFLSEDAVYDPLVDRLLDDHTAAALSSGACTVESLILSVPLDIDPGAYTLFAAADYADVLAEPDEGNNVLGIPFTVEGILVPPIQVTLSPHDPPVALPAGGAFTFDVLVASLSMTSETFDVWAEAERPGGILYRRPRFGPYEVTLAPGETLGPVTLRLRVPASAPPGVYLFLVSAGTFPDDPIDAESFEVEVLPNAGRTVASTAEWSVEQLGGPPLAGLSAEGTGAVATHGVRPNPARDRATVSFALAEAAEVRLRVYDLLGRAVLDQPAQALPAGLHALSLDVRALPAGVYLYRIEAGDRPAATGRLSVVQ